MRLIDADAKIKELKRRSCLVCQEKQYDEDKCNRYGVCLIDDVLITELKNTPTIEAIPISFLYEYMALCESVGAYQSKETIECLIDDWREENGEKDEC